VIADTESITYNNEQAQELVNGLQVLQVVGPSVHSVLHDRVSFKRSSIFQIMRR
jgi:hypothetical protein